MFSWRCWLFRFWWFGLLRVRCGFLVVLMCLLLVFVFLAVDFVLDCLLVYVVSLGCFACVWGLLDYVAFMGWLAGDLV